MPQAFFRRAVQSGKDKVYRCKRSGDCQVIQKNCPIWYLKTHTAGQSQPSHGIVPSKLFFQVSVASRRSCQKCRFLKCIAVGMTAAWVLSEEQCTIRSPKQCFNNLTQNPISLSYIIKLLFVDLVRTLENVEGKGALAK